VFVVFGAGLGKGLEAGAALDVLVRDSDFVGTAIASVGVSATVGNVLVLIN
jgi:F0F1-type ATP synthase membrane subunit c/vacuolar-type H+-ATPase subunit K